MRQKVPSEASLAGLHIDSTGRCYAVGPGGRDWLRERQGVHPLQKPKRNFNQLQLPVGDGVYTPGKIALAGNLETFDNAIEIIGFLGNSRRTGLLTFWADHARHCLYLDGGKILAAHTSDRGDRLGQVLYRRGAIPLDILTQATIDARNSTMPLGNHLVREGHLLRADLQTALEAQVADVVFSIVLLEKGDFIFAVESDSTISRTVEIDIQFAIMDALRRHDEIHHVENRLTQPGVNRVSRSSNDTLATDLGVVAHDIWASLETPLALSDLCDRVSHSRRTILETLYHGFQGSTFCIVDPTVAPAALAPVPDVSFDETSPLNSYNQLIADIHLAARSNGHPHSLPRTLTSFLQFHGYTSLFHGVRIDDSGRLDLQSFTINLAAIEISEEPEAYASRALDAFVNFALLAMRSRLSIQDRRRFSGVARMIRQGNATI